MVLCGYCGLISVDCDDVVMRYVVAKDFDILGLEEKNLGNVGWSEVKDYVKLIVAGFEVVVGFEE